MQNSMEKLQHHFRTVWLFTVSDHLTFVLPETAFGIFGALSGSALTNNPSPRLKEVLARLPLVLAWTWTNTFVFAVSNQASPAAMKEDSLNKSWRPLPSGRLTLRQARRILLIAIPTVLILSHFCLGAFENTAVLFSLTWMYNEVGGGDDGCVLRNLIIAVAYVFYGSGALRVASGPHHSANEDALAWSLVIGGVIFTTMSVQDLKDQEGDRARGRRTIPLVVGDGPTRYMLAATLVVWSLVCTSFWRVGWVLAAVCFALASFVAWRLLGFRDRVSDRTIWKMWSLWPLSLYLLPMYSR